jgi:ankyrin repeat protein
VIFPPLPTAALSTVLVATLLAGCVAGLHQAVRDQDPAAVSRAIQEGASLNALNDEGLAPLHIAAAKPDPRAVRKLLEAGADPNLASQWGEPPLSFAAENEPAGSAMVRLLLGHGADPGGIDGGTPPLLKAVQAGNLPAMMLLAEAGADPNVQKFGFTPLVSAIQHKHRPMVEYLIAHGADVNLPSGHSCSPIGYAAASADLELVRLLLDAGADPDEQQIGETPLTLAVMHHHPEMVLLLLERGANPDRKGQGAAYYPIHRAILNDNMPILELLLAHGADPMVRDSYRRTALDLATGLISPLQAARYSRVLRNALARNGRRSLSAAQ